MKKKIFSATTIILTIAMMSLSSCLKDASFVDLSKVGTIAEFPTGGLASFSSDAITASGPAITMQFAINIASPSVPSSATTVTVGVDNTIIAPYNASNTTVSYLPFPTGSYTFPDQTVTIPAGSRTATFTLTMDKSQLDPSKSYMLPITIKNVPAGITISGNMGIHYYHVIGNDFAGSYIWDYRRWQNGVGPIPYVVPSQTPGGGAPDIQTLGQAGKILPVSPTEFQMETGYNGQHVMYDVTFKRTVSGSVVTYSNWAVSFPAVEIAKWTAAGITNFVPPAFTIPPPANNSSPKIFELNFASGGAAPGRYIDDTYH